MPTDTERLDKLEKWCWSDRVINGVVLFPSRNPDTSDEHLVVQDLGEEDGSGLGDELTGLCENLRAAIDALPNP